MTTTMAKKRTTKNTKKRPQPWQWLGGAQSRTRKKITTNIRRQP